MLFFGRGGSADGDGSSGGGEYDDREPLVPVDDPDDPLSAAADAGIELNPRTGSTGHQPTSRWMALRYRAQREWIRLRRVFPRRLFAVLITIELCVFFTLVWVCAQPLNNARTIASAAPSTCSPPPPEPPKPTPSASASTAVVTVPAVPGVPPPPLPLPPAPTKTVILYLLASYPADIAHLRSSLDLLECHLLSAHGRSTISHAASSGSSSHSSEPKSYPIIIFYSSLTDAVKSELASRAPSAESVSFVPVPFGDGTSSDLRGFPTGFNPDAEAPVWTKRTRWGYSHMISMSWM